MFSWHLDAISDIDNHDGPDAQSLGSVSNTASVSGHAMRSIKAVPDMREKVAMDNYLIEARNARGSVSDDSELPVKNLMEKFTAKDAEDIRLQASHKLDLDKCTVEKYLIFLQGLNDGWHSRSNNENEISNLVNSVSFDNLLSTNMKGETSRLYI